MEKILSGIFDSALDAVRPYACTSRHLDSVREEYENGRYGRLVVAGFGKASCLMAKAVEDAFGGQLKEGVVITKYGHGTDGLMKTRVFEAGHPTPDKNGLKGTEEIIGLLGGQDERTLVICLVSGGGSALLVSPAEGITLEEKREITGLLLKAGADIGELNAVRKHISRVKGGRLAGIARPAGIVSLILSDVIGDRLDVIASGPTSPDGSTYGDAIGVLEKFGLSSAAPASIVDFLRRGEEGEIPETPKEGDAVFERAKNIIIGSNFTALEAAKRKAIDLGFQTEILTFELSGEARDAAIWLADRAAAKARSKGSLPICLLSGGETTVTVKGEGKGGRNTEFALSFAERIKGIKGIHLLSAGTDGTDGPTDAAGAFADGYTAEKARMKGLETGEFLKRNDSYGFFKKAGGLFVTGPTGTNVMDVQITVIE